MGYTVYIENTRTKEIRRHRAAETFDWTAPFEWSRGKFSCDCTLSAFYWRRDAKAETCGRGQYTVPFIMLDDGEKVVLRDEKYFVI